MDSTAGGFILSPPLSVSSSGRQRAFLPHPRSSPLKPGGSKESTFIRYVDQQVLHVQRRFAKRVTPDVPGTAVERDAAAIWDNVQGYTSMREACKDIEELINIIWTSGTPALQVPYLINVASLLSMIIQAMPATPRPLFNLLNRLDLAFASLRQEQDVETGEALPGFNTGRGVSGTEKVRIRSIVERTRRCTMEAFKSAELDLDFQTEPAETADETDGELVLEDSGAPADEPTWEMELARVYDRTVVELGDSLEQPNLGVLTE